MKNLHLTLAAARDLFAVVGATTVSLSASGQGLITFNAHANWSGTNYVEQGVQFRVMAGGNSDQKEYPPKAEGKNRMAGCGPIAKSTTP